jgi:excinuclease ABC subunit C
MSRLRRQAQADGIKSTEVGEQDEPARVSKGEGGVTLSVPLKGKLRELLDIAQKNAEERLHTVLLGSDGDYVITPGQRALAQHLDLPEFPRRIEGYDIANLQGKQATGAMVVFEGGRKAAREYRLFNIRLKDTPDDFAMLRETLLRRFNRLLRDPKWQREVDLIMIDGGKGQLSAAKQAAQQICASPEYSQEEKERIDCIKLISLAKQEELVYHYGAGGEVVELRLPHDDDGLRLLVAVRNEAHRYGNSQHSRMRDKVMTISVLDTIPGLGELRKRALVRHFGSARRIREASVEELAEVKGIGPKYAELLRRYLDRDEELEDGKAEYKREMQIRRISRPGDAKNV